MAARHPSAQVPFASIDIMPHGDMLEVLAGERIGAPPPRLHRGSSWTSSFLALALLASVVGGFAMLRGEWRAAIVATGWAWASEGMQKAADLMARPAPPASQPATTPVPLAATGPLPQRDVTAAAGEQAGTLVTAAPSQSVATDAGSDGADSETPAAGREGGDEAATQAPPEPLPPPVADPSDPLQKRALAIGLHPDLSRAVLERFSPEDWRNARHAVSAALASGSDTRAFVWPRAARNKLAQFEVHFVAAAGAECRRYVVTVSKDRWSTTARAMELCGRDRAKFAG